MLGFYPLASAPIADDANVSVVAAVTGVQGTTALGTAIAEADANVNVTGVQGTTVLGETTETGTSKVYPTGVQATGQVGTVLVWGQIVPDQTPNWSKIAA